MATSRVVTRTAADAQPFPRIVPTTARQEKRLNLSDSAVVVKWLNAAQAANAPASYKRVCTIRRQLEEFEGLRANLSDYRRPDAKKWEAAVRKYEIQRELLLSGKKSRAVRFPGSRNSSRDADVTKQPAYKRLHQQTERLHSEVNESLHRYAFRPRVTYFVVSEIWRGGMVPDEVGGMFALKLNNQTTISEADSVLSLVRLHLVGELGTVALCEMCKVRWFARVKKHYRFCPDGGCREKSYGEDPKFRRRKAANQRRYRQNKKLALQRGFREK